MAGSLTCDKLRGLCRKRGVLTEENIAWLEQVFRENVGKGKEEFTLDEFKKIVPSKNVSRKVYKIMINISKTHLTILGNISKRRNKKKSTLHFATIYVYTCLLMSSLCRNDRGDLVQN